MIKTIFFGSTSDSVLVLQALKEFSTIQQYNNITITAIITQPPRPVGRDQIITPAPVEIWAKNNTITVLSFPTNPDKPWLYKDEQVVVDTLQSLKADMLISACYGQKIPFHTIQSAKFGGLNVHPSLLPRWRGADPVPWAILSGDAETGVTIVTLSEHFDEGKIVAQKTHFLRESALPDATRTELFTTGADLLCSILPDYIAGKAKMTPQDPAKATTAHRLSRGDGFIPWELLQKAMQGEPLSTSTMQQYNNVTIIHAVMEHTKHDDLSIALLVDRAIRALSPWPGLWTNIMIKNVQKRVKILKDHLSSNNVTMQQFNNYLILDLVQMEGKTPVSWTQFSSAYI